MSFSDVSTLTKVSAFFALVALVLDVVSVATPHWQSGSGLWQVCETVGSVTTCTSINGASDKFQTVRAFAVIGVLLGAAALGLLVLFICRYTQRRVKVVIISLSGLAALCTLIGFCIYTSIGGGGSYEYSFILNVVSAVLYVIVAVLLAVDRHH
ncbi:hypothetical protein LOTGIDRAFT_161675 [Lottia gigantea]|uniref:Uncharacterized protein n=1 Tax=Lottia gigantea TaxID=225164 RepID=V4BWZ2_LOTGI|nr:hypothetical protein LOTGIDRAFT_161675 [Lottia gigantea]ESO93569.1 hypothetical protein LOTGIDRAFT_161675 [Lottia gigantea]